MSAEEGAVATQSKPSPAQQLASRIRPSLRRFASTATSSTTSAAVANVAAAHRISDLSSITKQYSSVGETGSPQLDADDSSWLTQHAGPESDDWLHHEDAVTEGAQTSVFRQSVGTMVAVRSLVNMGTLALLTLGILLLIAVYPIIDWAHTSKETFRDSFYVGGVNMSSQIFDGVRGLVDRDTPASAWTRMSMDGKKKMQLVFSDEFEVPGRSFYPGHDPFFEAVDLRYWGTNDYEWYDPAAITTVNGSLAITLSEVENHELNFRSGMLQTWNKFCWTGGLIEVRVLLPGSKDIPGLWPGCWLLGNLGRAGYGASNHGNWPYTYDSCDVGTLSAQTWAPKQGGGPIWAETTGVYNEIYGPALSYMDGQRLSRCTCLDDEDHPGPRHPDGSFVGRSAPEIDVLEAIAGSSPESAGHVSMTLQLAPFNSGYNLSTTENATIFYDARAERNNYTGTVIQQAASGYVETGQNYADQQGRFERYAMEYKPGKGQDAYVSWSIEDKPMWRINAAALAPDPLTEIDQRPIPEEPMSLVLNLGMSAGFVRVDWENITFPATFLIDYVRVYQDEDAIDVGCDPPHHPTAAYIEKHWEVSSHSNNPNLSSWTEPRERGGYAHKFPGNRLKGEC